MSSSKQYTQPMEPSCTVFHKQKFRVLSSPNLTALAMLVVFFLVLRLGLIFFGYSHIAHPGFDEPVSGVLACDILDEQIRAPLFSYQYESRSGDSLIEGLILVPFFKLFGRSIFSTKLVALVSSLSCLLLWIIFITKYHGVGAALVFASLFAFSPPMFARLNVLGTVDSHHVINPILAVQILLLFRIIQDNEHKASWWVWMAFGFCAGLGVYTFYTYFIFVAFCLLFLLVFRPSALSFRYLIICCSGFLIGFAPWIVRSVSSRGGGEYLVSILKNVTVDPWRLMQNIGFSTPHSFGYNYPYRTIGFISVLFSLYVLFYAVVLLKNSLRNASLYILVSKKGRTEPSPAARTGLFCVVFPVFFLICLSLSPMHINPFEYWPTIGLFAGFPSADIFRYRWLYILYPFYFAVCAMGMATFCNSDTVKFLRKLIAFCSLILFLICGAKGVISLYSMRDFGKIFYYKGYHYDLFTTRFILGDFTSSNLKRAVSIIRNYPEESKPAAYQCLATLIAKMFIHDPNHEARLEELLRQVPDQYQSDFIYGIVRILQDLTVHNITEKDFSLFAEVLTKKHPEQFYKNWGVRYLGYKYYGLLVNQKTLFDNIPQLEQWFYRDFLNKFKTDIADNSTLGNGSALMNEITNILPEYQDDVVRGLGILVGAEMLFDTLHEPDYPLDSNFGKKLPVALQDAFYEGVGAGFAETLCRFWRMLMLDKVRLDTENKKLLDMEWNRCHDLMKKMPQQTFHLLEKGFAAELQSRILPLYIRTYITDRMRNT